VTIAGLLDGKASLATNLAGTGLACPGHGHYDVCAGRGKRKTGFRSDAGRESRVRGRADRSLAGNDSEYWDKNTKEWEQKTGNAWDLGALEYSSPLRPPNNLRVIEN
jgi:hypothetical protein